MKRIFFFLTVIEIWTKSRSVAIFMGIAGTEELGLVSVCSFVPLLVEVFYLAISLSENMRLYVFLLVLRI